MTRVRSLLRVLSGAALAVTAGVATNQVLSDGKFSWTWLYASFGVAVLALLYAEVWSASSPSRSANPASREEAIQEAKTGRIVDVRFIGYTGESLFNQMRDTLMQLSNSRGRVESVTLRMLTPDLSSPTQIPAKRNSDGTVSDDPDFRRYTAGRTGDYASHLLSFERRLREQTGMPGSLQFRTYPGIPVVQICLIGENVAFFAFYDISRETEFPYGQPDRILLDPGVSRAGSMGWDIRDGGRQSEYMVKECSNFFESMWRISNDAS